MGLLSLLGGLAKLFSGLLAAFREAGLRQEGRDVQAAQDRATIAEETVDEITRAQDARRAAEHVLDREPERLRDDDGFKRPG